MELSRWWPWYEKIATQFGYSTKKDREATLVLRELLFEAAAPISDLKSLIEGKHVVVFGAGPSLEENISEMKSASLWRLSTCIVADGATTAFLEKSIAPHIIVTDLDGRIEDIIKASKHGSAMVIHGHGDNIDALKKWVPRIIENRAVKVFGTTQVEPYPSIVYNFGGFTDGDRGVFLAEEMKARSIVLAGMDLGTTIGKYSKNRPWGLSRVDEDKWLSNKRLKLRFAKELLESLPTWVGADVGLYNATGPKGETVRGFNQIQFKDLKKTIMSV